MEMPSWTIQFDVIWEWQKHANASETNKMDAAKSI